MTAKPRPEVQHVWYYQKPSLLGVRDEGPFTDAQLLQLAKDNELSLATPIRSPSRTNNQWIKAAGIQALAVAINQAKLDADVRKRATAEAKKQHKQELSIAKQNARAEEARVKAVEKEKSLQAEKNRTAELKAEQAKTRHGHLMPTLPQSGYVQQPTACHSGIPFQQIRSPAPIQQTIVVQQAPSGSAATLGAIVNAVLSWVWAIRPGVLNCGHHLVVHTCVFCGHIVSRDWIHSCSDFLCSMHRGCCVVQAAALTSRTVLAGK